MRNMINTKSLCTDMKVPSSSDSISTGSADELSISITMKNATGVKINFLASIDSISYMEIEGTAMNSGDTFVTSTGVSQIYSFDVSMTTSFKVELESITGGSVSVYATSFSIN